MHPDEEDAHGGERVSPDLDLAREQSEERDEKLPEDERETRRVWAGKMLDRAREGDIEANYRRVWLLTSLLEDYFQLRDQWYLGPKKSLIWLKEHDPATYTAFDLALQPNASFEQIALLIARVITV